MIATTGSSQKTCPAAFRPFMSGKSYRFHLQQLNELHCLPKLTIADQNPRFLQKLHGPLTRVQQRCGNVLLDIC
jgi:hypothetical protein